MIRQGLQGQTLTLRMTFYDNGLLYDPETLNDVKIYDTQVAGNLVTTLTPERESLGVYFVEWEIPDGQARGTYWDEWTYRALDFMLFEIFRASFIVGGDFTIAPTHNTQTLENRLNSIATAVNNLQNAILNLPNKRQLNMLVAQLQLQIDEVVNDLSTHEAVDH